VNSNLYAEFEFVCEFVCRAYYKGESPQSLFLQWSYGGVERSELAQVWPFSGVRGGKPVGGSQMPSTFVRGFTGRGRSCSGADTLFCRC